MKGVAKVKGTVKILLDLDRVLGHRRRRAARCLGLRRWGHAFTAAGRAPALRRRTRADRPVWSTSAPASRCTAGSGRWSLAPPAEASAAGGFSSFRDYLEHVEADATGAEITTLLDAIATNHTSFFREPQHFEFLKTTVVPALGPKRPAAGLERGVLVWRRAGDDRDHAARRRSRRTHQAADSRSGLRPVHQGARDRLGRRLQDGTGGRHPARHAAPALPARARGADGQARVARARAARSSSIANSISSKPATWASAST